MSKTLHQPTVPFDQRVAVSIRDAVEIIGIGRSKLCECINMGAVRTVKIGRRRLVLVDSTRILLKRPHDERASRRPARTLTC